MATENKCNWLGETESGDPYCRLRGQKLHKAEVNAKCLKPDLATICVDAYSSLARGQDALDSNSTDAFPWLIESASQFENLGEADNAIHAYVKAINFANKTDLVEKAYDLFRSARTVYEEGIADKDPALNGLATKQELMKAGEALIDKIEQLSERKPTTELQSELKAAVLGGVTLKKANPKEDTKDLIISHGRSLYTKKAEEYKDGAASYIKSGMIKNAVTLACMGALADLMLGKPKEGMAYLAEITTKSGESQTFQEHPCFEWTKVVFKVLINRDQNLMITANKLFLEIPWSFKDDREFARRVLESVERRISA
ncbi:MAG: hypothetical protein KGD60_00410 [Candidatus Thorarchaeota archaeon]|nr:hypothetical protein [Candidatus Thorarchaeota archaeon]